MSEQDLIKKYFSRHRESGESVELSVGDDAAILLANVNSKLVVTTDTLNLNQHFFADHPAEALGHKSLAVNLSDIAAMGATPCWATLSLSIPKIDHNWLRKFSNGLYTLADKYEVKLVGGDLVKGPLSITLQLIGKLNTRPLLRSNCEANDLIYVTGTLGDPAIGYKLLSKDFSDFDKQDREYFLNKLYRPDARLDASNTIVKYSKAAIDISDGLLIDLQRMLTASKRGARIHLDRLPISEILKKYFNKVVNYNHIITGGEDYQLLFSVKPSLQTTMEEEFTSNNIKITQIGEIIEGAGVELYNSGTCVDLPKLHGFDHFS